MAGNAPRSLTCARCGGAFECGNGGRDGGCWCVDESFRVPMPTSADEDCLCSACLRIHAESCQNKSDQTERR